jgi:hypothetical protein
MRNDEIDGILKRAAQPDPDPAVTDRISRSIAASLAPVRPLPPVWALVAAAIAFSMVLGAAGAMILKPLGILRMNAVQAGTIFPLVVAVIWLVAWLSVAESIPGSRRPANPWTLAAAVLSALALVFAFVFPDYRTERFVSEGIRCLTAGVAQAIPAAVAVWLLLRRGFSVNPAASGFARGALAGSAGVFMLELHCPNFEAPHVIVWHIAVLPVCGLVGVAAGMHAARRSSGTR